MLIEAGVDWLTSTCLDAGKRQSFRDAGLSIVGKELERGNIGKPWSWKAYQGVSCGQVEVGERYDSVIVRLRGALASENWRDVFPLSTNCSRVDFQYTIRTDCDNRRLLGDIYRQFEARPSGLRAKPVVAFVSGTNGAATLYLGSRQSCYFGRIYEKGVESGETRYDNCLRCEWEVKGGGGSQWLAMLGEREAELANVVAAVAGRLRTCHDSLRDLTREPWLDRAYLERQFSELSHSPSARASDCERRRRWLSNSVKPCVQDMVNRGMLRLVLADLGLQEYVSINPTRSK